MTPPDSTSLRRFPFPQLNALRDTPAAMQLLPLVRQGLVSFDIAPPWTLQEIDRHVRPNVHVRPRRSVGAARCGMSASASLSGRTASSMPGALP
jgi:hypothetical protein